MFSQSFDIKLEFNLLFLFYEQLKWFDL